MDIYFDEETMMAGRPLFSIDVGRNLIELSEQLWYEKNYNQEEFFGQFKEGLWN